MRRALRSETKSADVFDWPWSSAPPDWFLRYGTAGTVEKAVGVPALLGVLSLISRTIGTISPIVYRRGAAGVSHERADDTPQWRLLHDSPSASCLGAFPFWSDCTMSLAAAGNLYVRKWFGGGSVRDLETLDARDWKPRRQPSGEVVFDQRSRPNDAALTRREILHVRGPSLVGGLEGVAPVTELRMTVQQGLSRAESVARMWENDAWLGLVMKTAMSLTQEQADEWSEKWKDRHSGPRNAGKPTIIPATDDLSRIPLSLDDLQFVESHRSTREEICGVYGIPPRFAGDSQAPVDPSDERRLVKFGLGPYMSALEQGFSADRDLFPVGSGLFMEFLADSLMRPDTKDRYEAYRLARQGGWITANELRAFENLGPHEGGDQIQETPVGGAPNPTGGAG